MSRSARAAVVAAAALGACGVGTTALAATTGGSVCKSFSASGLTLKWSVIGNVSCSQAKPWLIKILAAHGKPDTKAALKPPAGFHCSAFNDAHGRASAGGCFTGTAAYPGNGFQWLG